MADLKGSGGGALTRLVRAAQEQARQRQTKQQATLLEAQGGLTRARRLSTVAPGSGLLPGGRFKRPAKPGGFPKIAQRRFAGGRLPRRR